MPNQPINRKKFPLIIAENDDDMRLIISKMLRSQGYTVHEASNGRKAIDLIREYSDGLLITDHKLPDMNSIELIKTIKKDKADIPFIGMTAFGSKEDTMELMALGAMDYIQKGKDFFDNLPGIIDNIYHEIELERLLIDSKQELSKKEKFERVLINISSEFINMDLNKLDLNIIKLMRLASKFMNADLAQIWIFNDEMITKRAEWKTDEYPIGINKPSPMNLWNEFPWFYEELRKGEIIKVTDRESIPESAPRERVHFTGDQPRSLLMIPMFEKDKLLFGLSFERIGELSDWHDEDVSLMSIAAEIIKNSLLRESDENERISSQEKFKALFDNSYDGIFLVDHTGIIIRANNKFYEITGYNENEVIGKYFWEFQYELMPVDKKNVSLEEYSNKVRRDLYVEKRYGLHDYRISTGYGYDKYIEANTFAINDSSGTMISSVIRDITSRKILEDQLIRSKEQWEKTFDSVPDMIAILDKDYSYKRMNKLMKDRFVNGFKDYMGQKCYLDVDKFNLDPEERLLDQTNDLFNEIYSEEDNRYYLVSQSPLYDNSGSFEGSVHVARDVTLIKKNEIYKELITNVSEQILMSTDLNDIYSSLPALLSEKLNLKWAAIEFYDKENDKIINKGQSGLDPNYISKIEDLRYDLIKDVLEEGKLIVRNFNKEDEYSKLDFKGLEVVSLVMAPIYVNNIPEGCIVLADNIEHDDLNPEFETINTIARLVSQEVDRRIAQKKYKDLAKELEERVESRTSQLEIAMNKLKTEIKVRMDTEEKLMLSKNEITQAYENEKQLHELKMRFVTMISHEYRTPLTVIVTSAFILEKLSEKFDNDLISSHIMKIQKAVKSMTHLLEEVLLIGKFESGQTRVMPSEIELDVFCREIVDEISFITDNKNEIKFNIKGDYELVQTDEKLLKQIISNILLNAVKYTRDNSPVNFEVNCTELDMIFKFEDKGIGIESSEIRLIFDSFYRGNNVGNTPGTGLGLAIAKKCIDLLNGTLQLESELGEGSTFKVKLPKLSF